MKRINLIFILNLLLSFQVSAEIIEFYDYTGTHLAYELNSETKEAKVGIYKGFSDGNPHSTAPCIHWQDKNDYTDYFRNLIIPNTIEYEGIYYTITSIAPYAFCEDTRVETIKLPETISTIGANAFYFCVNLTSINLPNAVTAINKQTFEQCTKLKINSLGKNITKIDSRAFFDCHSITELNIPGKCEVIENDAFSWCKGLKKLIIEDSNTILSLGYSYSLSLHYQGQDKASYRGAFADCPIEELYMGRNISFPVSTNKSYPPFTGISNYCTNTTGYQGPTGKTLKKLQFGESVTNLPNQLFYKSSLQCDIILPPYIETIGNECFNLSFFNNQVEITFPKTLKSVGNKWYDTSDHDKIKFINCEGEIPASGNFSGYVVYVPSGAGDIYKNSDSWKNSCIIDPSDKLISINVKTAGTLYSRILAQDVQISDVTRLKLKGTLNNDDWNVIKTMNNIHELDLLEISNDLFPTDYFKNWSFITKIILPKNLSSIGDYMFYGCSHLNCIIEIPQNCKKIGEYAFFRTPIKGLSYSGPIEIGKNAFRQCANLDSINISGIGSKIGYQSFWGSSLKKITIGKGVEIADEAFYYNEKLKEVILEDSVKSIGNSVFDYCKNFTKLTICGIVENISDMKYKYLSEIHIFDIEKWVQNKFDKLESSPLYYGKLFINGVEPTEIKLSDDINKIGDYAFYNCNSISKLELSKNCIEIGNYAFFKCNQIDTLILPENLKKIGTNAFYGLTALKELKLPISLKSIGESAFGYCSSLKIVVAQWENPFSIGNSTFHGISNNCYLYIPILTASKYLNSGWAFPNIKEVGIITIKTNVGGYAEYDKNVIYNSLKEFLFTPYKSFYINFVAEEGYYINQVNLNGENVTSLLEDNRLYIEEPEENIDLVVVFANKNIKQGDINSDSEVNVTDVVTLYSYILGNTNGIDKNVADLNNDGEVNVTDIVNLYSIILNGENNN